MSTTREALKAAIEAHTAAIAAVKSADETLKRAAAYQYELTIKLAEFADLDARVAAERADAVKRAIVDGGNAPVFEMSSELMAAVAHKHDAENRLAAARQAVEALQNEHDEAKRAAEQASLALEWAAEKVMASEADALAAEYAEKLAEVRALYLAMWGISTVQIRRPPHEINRINQSQVRALAMPPAAGVAVRDADVRIETPSTRRHVWREAVRGAVAGWFGALKSDAEARLDVPKEGLCVVANEADAA